MGVERRKPEEVRQGQKRGKEKLSHHICIPGYPFSLKGNQSSARDTAYTQAANLQPQNECVNMLNRISKRCCLAIKKAETKAKQSSQRSTH